MPMCVKQRRCKEAHVRGYYRQKPSLENILPIFQKGGRHACIQAPAYHIVPGRFNPGVIISPPRAGGISSAFASAGCERRPGLDRTRHASANWSSASEPRGANAPPRAEAIAMGPTRVTWSLPPGALRNASVPRDREGQFHSQVAGALQSL
jgi:hypothetical protein